MTVTKKVLFSTWLVLISMFLYCSMKICGVISETTNGITVSGITVDSLGNYLENVTIYLRSASYLADGTGNSWKRTTQTDSTGSFHIDSVFPGLYVLEASTNTGKGFAYPFKVFSEDTFIFIEDSIVKHNVLISGIVAAPAQVGEVTVQAMGLDVITKTDSAGGFSLEMVPGGNLLCRFSSPITQYKPLMIPSSVVIKGDSITLDTLTSTLIENFDDGNNQHLLYDYRQIGRWYACDGPGITLLPEGVLDNPSLAFSSEEAWNGKSLSAQIIYSDTAHPAFVGLFAIELGSGAHGYPLSTRWHDLTKMNELVFMAKGTDTLVVCFITRLIKEEYTPADHFQSIVVLTDQWQEYRISREIIAPPEWSSAFKDGRKWSETDHEVAEISFFAINTITFSLDEIRLIGITPLELITP